MRSACLLLALTCACAHVDIPPHPPKSAPESERESYRARFRSDSVDRLADGTVVDDPGDLTPALDDDTDAARALRSASAKHVFGEATTAAGGVLVGGMLATVVGLGVVSNGNYSDSLRLVVVSASLGGLLGLGVVVVGAYVLPAYEADDVKQARLTFAHDLDQTLALAPRKSAPTSTSTSTSTPAPTAPPASTPAPGAPPPPSASTTDDRAESIATNADALPLHFVLKEQGAVVAELQTGPDDVIAPISVDESHRNDAAEIAGDLGVNTDKVFACFMRSFPKAGAKQSAHVHIAWRNGELASVSASDALSKCVGHALKHGGLGGKSTSFEMDIDVDHVAGPFVGSRCRSALANGAAQRCLGLTPVPEAMNAIAGVEANMRPLLIAEAFREDVCAAHSNGFALCKRKRVDGLDPAVLANEVRAIEDAYVRQLSDDDAVIRAAMQLVAP